jgi:hypothetical protein
MALAAKLSDIKHKFISDLYQGKDFYQHMLQMDVSQGMQMVNRNKPLVLKNNLQNQHTHSCYNLYQHFLYQ